MQGQGELQLRHFRAYKDNSLTVYNLQLTDGRRHWEVARRYSEFLQCHVQLLELFGREELPPFPPKEPLLRKLFKPDGRKPSEWAEERKVLLYHYLTGLLEEQRTATATPLLRFLDVVAPEPTMLDSSTADAEADGDWEVDAPHEGVDESAVAKAVRATGEEEAADCSAETIGGPSRGCAGEAAQQVEDLAALSAQELSKEEAETRDGGAARPDEGEASKSANGTSGGACPHTEAISTRSGVDAQTQDTGDAGVQVADSAPHRNFLFPTQIHNIISYKGSAAAAYAHRVGESQRLSLERAPQRFEKSTDGRIRSIGVKLTVVGTDEAKTKPSADELDSSRQEQRLQQLREEERHIAHWIHGITGDPGAEAAAEGVCSLEAALRSGEALCDVVNAVWPGRIVGIMRGDIASASPRASRRRLANITLFIQACVDLGVDESRLFTPADLHEGKGLRSVHRCVEALAALAAETPEFDGPPLSLFVACKAHARPPVAAQADSEELPGSQGGGAGGGA